MTNSKAVSVKHYNKIFKAAIFSGVLNALINGTIGWFQVKSISGYFSSKTMNQFFNYNFS